MRKIRTVLVGPPALSNVIRHLFQDRPEFEFVGCLPGLRKLDQEVARLVPELIIANVKPVRTGICKAVRSIRHSSPFARLILICPDTELSDGARSCGADACLELGTLVRSLIPAASALSPPQTLQFRSVTATRASPLPRLPAEPVRSSLGAASL